MWFPHLIVLLALYTFGPGLLLVRPLRLAPGERLCAAVGVGLFLDYLLSFAVFANGLSVTAHLLVTVTCAGLLLLGRRDWLALLRSRQVRRMLLAWGCLLAWGLILIAMVRHYGGGTWGGDWQEHYERTRFLQGGREYGFQFIDQYPFPMRPPMMNAVVAGVLAQVVDYDAVLKADRGYVDYDAFQVAFVFLNSLVVLPCLLLPGRLVKLSPRLARRATWTLAAVLAASPMVSQNLSYAWTKLFAAFYALLAVAIYLRAWRRGERAEGGRPRTEALELGAQDTGKQDVGAKLVETPRPPNLVLPYFAFRPQPFALSPRFPLAFALLCVGFLVHFSVGPYGLFLGLHYLLAVWWRRPKKWAEAISIGSVSLAVLACWFVWSGYHYGAKTTFTSTSAVSDSVKMTAGENAANVAKNVGNTLLPTVVRAPSVLWTQDLEQPGLAGQARDFTFLIYQVSLPGGLGFVGCGLTLVLLWRAVTGRTPTVPAVRRFWLTFIPVVFLVGTAVYGGVDRFGVAHICLQPLILCGLCLVAGGVWTLGGWARSLLVGGLLLDFSLGVFLQATLEHRLFPVNLLHDVGGTGSPSVGYEVISGPDVPSRAAQNNLGVKLLGRFTFFGDHFADKDADLLPLLQAALAGLLALLLAKGFRSLRARPRPVAANGYDPRCPTAVPAKESPRPKDPSRKRPRNRR